VVVSDLFVRQFLPEDDPIGRRLRVNVDGTGSKDYAIVKGQSRKSLKTSRFSVC